MKVLHITNWYPGKFTPDKAQWIKNQINTLKDFQNITYHLEVRKAALGFNYGINKDKSRFIIINLPFTIWPFIELLSGIMVIWIIFVKERNKDFNIINFHIAYPNLTWLHIFKKRIKIPMVISEHWSGYHFNFNVKNSNNLQRIKRIFKQKLPVITVSKSLKEDIKNFAKADFTSYIIPNVVNTKIFYYRKSQKSITIPVFFMVSQWKWPKDPFTVINAINLLQSDFPDIQLRIGGYGPQWNKMKEKVNELKLGDKVFFLGKLSEVNVAAEMRKCSAFIHSSEYETFSVVCAEAIACGTPVIASAVGGIPEFINDENGILVKSQNAESFSEAIIRFLKREPTFNKYIVAQHGKKFSEDNIGRIYQQALIKVSEDYS